jgi:hypothetical protein
LVLVLQPLQRARVRYVGIRRHGYSFSWGDRILSYRFQALRWLERFSETVTWTALQRLPLASSPPRSRR